MSFPADLTVTKNNTSFLNSLFSFNKDKSSYQGHTYENLTAKKQDDAAPKNTEKAVVPLTSQVNGASSVFSQFQKKFSQLAGQVNVIVDNVVDKVKEAVAVKPAIPQLTYVPQPMPKPSASDSSKTDDKNAEN